MTSIEKTKREKVSKLSKIDLNVFLNLNNEQPAGYYWELARTECNEKTENQMGVDLPRTFANNIFFTDKVSTIFTSFWSYKSIS